jgi:UV excision repair protein RAD23
LSEDTNEEEDNPLPPGAQAISVTEEEREAIERVCYNFLFSSRGWEDGN